MQYEIRWIQNQGEAVRRRRYPPGRRWPAHVAEQHHAHTLPEKFDKDNKKPFRSRQSPSDDRRARHGTLNGFGPPPCGAGHQAAQC
ncbi:hypothetical protein ACIP1U_10020 [Cupriavidus sp. NPDC089707]|uniref:hypothetical protein n=1 Tax=Cupriavidus sp. NPDC089707 TaxID=3363963 RepID=UPI00382B0682